MKPRFDIRSVLFAILVMGLAVSPAKAGGRTKIVQETAEYLLQRWGKTAFREGAQTLAGKIESYVVRHGDDFVKAIRQCGPRTFHIVEQAGSRSKQAVSVLANLGEQGAWALSRPKGMQLALKHGLEETTATLVKHKAVAEPILEKFGQPALKALQATSPQSARRLAMVMEDELAHVGRSSEILGVVSRFGDAGMEFVWKNKGALATATVLSAFLLRPEPFINGTERIVATVAESTVKPLAQIPATVATEAARGTNWTLVILGLGGAVIAILGIKYLRSTRGPSSQPETQPST